MNSVEKILVRFSHTAVDSLVNQINFVNNRGFTKDQFVFETPIPMDNYGKCMIGFKFAESTGWSQAKQFLIVHRQNVSEIPRLNPLVIHSTGYDVDSILTAIFDQYGWAIDKHLITMDRPEVAKVYPVKTLGKLDEIVDGDKPIIMDGHAEINIRFLDSHPLYYGSMQVLIRPSLSTMKGDIDSVLAVREFYSTGRIDLPFVETIQPRGEWKLSDSIADHQTRKVIESELAKIPMGGKLEINQTLVDVLNEVTGVEWSFDDDVSPYNLKGAKVLHNGIGGHEYIPTDPGYNYMLAIELSELCGNLQGIIRLSYRYSSRYMPGNLPLNSASLIPIINQGILK